MQRDDPYFLIEGKAESDIPLRPHNWAERFAGNLASFGHDQRLRYSNALTPVMVDNIKCLRVSRELENSHPALVHDMLKFAELHGLRVHGLDSEELALAS